MNADPFLYLKVCLLIAAAGACLGSVELLFLHKDLSRGTLSQGSFGHGRIAQICRQQLWKIGIRKFDYHITLLAVVAQLISSLLIAGFTLIGEISLAGLAIFVASGLLLRARGGLGNNGADEMVIVIMMAALLARIFNTAHCALIVLVFLSAQLSLSYLTSGLVKVRVLHWRDGTSLVNIMSTEAFGNRSLHAVLQSSPVCAAFISSILVFGELFGSVAPWLPYPYAISLLTCSFAFHMSAAFFMGLNTFVPAFVATYPAALYTSRVLYMHHGWQMGR